MERIGERLSDASRNRRLKKGNRQGGEFLRGPIPIEWLTAAARLPGKALAVGVAIWFRVGCQPYDADVSICNTLLSRLGVHRVSGYRGLAALEQAGLVAVTRHRGRCPRVKLCEAHNRRRDA